MQVMQVQSREQLTLGLLGGGEIFALSFEGCAGVLCEKRGKLLGCGEKSEKSTLDVWGWMEIKVRLKYWVYRRWPRQMNSWVWDAEGLECHAKWLGINPINIGVCVHAWSILE